jgi:hypothetical protein
LPNTGSICLYFFVDVSDMPEKVLLSEGGSKGTDEQATTAASITLTRSCVCKPPDILSNRFACGQLRQFDADSRQFVVRMLLAVVASVPLAVGIRAMGRARTIC